MAKVTVNIPEPVEATVTLEITLEEAKILRNVLGMTYGNGAELLFFELHDKVKGNLQQHRTYREAETGKLFIVEVER